MPPSRTLPVFLLTRASTRHLIALEARSDWNREDRRLETDLKQFKYDASQILGLRHEDSTRTSPFSNFLSQLDGCEPLRYTLQQLLALGFKIRAGTKTPWSAEEGAILEKVCFVIYAH